MINPLKYFRNRKVGLVLGSGGAKGISHISVIEYLNGLDIPVDMIVGSSIGAVIGAVYCAGSLERFKKDIVKLNRKGIIKYFDPVIPRSGLLEGRKIIDFLAQYIPHDKNIEDFKIKLGIVATNYFNGKSVLFRRGNVLEAIRASISVPGIFIPVKYRSTYLIDGGVANPLPVNVIRRMGAGLVVAVNLHPKIDERKYKKYIKSKRGEWEDLIDSEDIEIIDDQYELMSKDRSKQNNIIKSIEHWVGINSKEKEHMPNIIEVISRSIDIMEYVNTMVMLKYNSPHVLIEPDIPGLGTMDFSNVSMVMSRGYIACTKSRNALLRKIKFWI